MIEKRLRVGTRGSKLAIAQTHIVLKKLRDFFPNLIFEVKIIKTKGDKFQDQNFLNIEGKGLFTKEIEEQLLKNNIDIGVHSLKDLPTELPDGLMIGAVLPRDNPEDVLISKGHKLFDELPYGAKIGTSSLRRKVQLKRIRPDLEIVPIRGNVNTRIQKLFSSNLDAIIVARAGVERLGLQQSISQIISTDVIIPAVGQGVIAIQIHKDNTFAKEVIECLNDIETEYSIRAERAFLQEMGGGCHNPIAAFATIINYEIFIDGIVASTDGNLYYRSSVFGNAIEPEQAGKKLANEILSLGAKNIILNPAKTSN